MSIMKSDKIKMSEKAQAISQIL